MYQYQQLANALKEEILNGNLQKGDKLPSIRELVARYGVNKDTVQRALRSLKDESFIYAVEKSGYYVLKNPRKIIHNFRLRTCASALINRLPVHKI